VQLNDGRKSKDASMSQGRPRNTLSPEIEEKAVRLRVTATGASEAEMRKVIDRVWGLAEARTSCVAHVMNALATRSYLLCGQSPGAFRKGAGAGADAVISISRCRPRQEKRRTQTRRGWFVPARAVVVRINGATRSGFRGLALCAMAGVARVMVPKAERRADLERVATVAIGARSCP